MGVISERFPPANHRGFARKPMSGLVCARGGAGERAGGRGCFQLNAARYWFCERSVCIPGYERVSALTKTRVPQRFPLLPALAF